MSICIVYDFNKLDLSRIANAFGVKQVVPFSTHGQSKLDLVFTNLNAFYDVPKKLRPFGLSDHATVEVQPLEMEKLPSQKIVLQSRDLRATKRLAMRICLEEVDVFLWWVACRRVKRKLTPWKLCLRPEWAFYCP